MAQFHSHCQIFPIFPGALTSRHEAEHLSFLSFVSSSTTLEDDIENQDEHDLVADFSVSSVERSAHCVSVVNVVRRSEFKVRDSSFTVGAFTAARSHIAAHFPENSFASLINRPPPRAREAIKPDSVSLGWWE